MNVDHDPLSVLKFMDSLRVSKKIELKNLGKIYKQEVPIFLGVIEERPSSWWKRNVGIYLT